MSISFRRALLGSAAMSVLAIGQAFAGPALIVSTSTFLANTGEAAGLTPGAQITVDGTGLTAVVSSTTVNVNARANDSNLGVFTNGKAVNATPGGSGPTIGDGNFGITMPMAITTIAPHGTSSVAASDVYSGGTVLPTSSFVTSFPSKSEGTIFLTPDNSGVTVSGYHVTTTANTPSAVGALDVSNSSTSANTILNGNAAGNAPRQDNRTVAQFTLATNATQTTDVNAYSGNNARGVMLINGQYYMAGNGNLPADITAAANAANPLNTGVQVVTPGVNAAAPVAATAQATNGQQVGEFQINQAGYAQGTDKVIKDNNFRGMATFNNTLFVTKGSGGNGINTVYQVGAPGALGGGANLATGVVGTAPYTAAGTAGNTGITILPGLPGSTLSPSHATDLATVGNWSPFGVFFANATTMYVADEGSGGAAGDTGLGSHAGLEKWTFDGNKWNLIYTLQSGLIGHTDNWTAAGFTGAVTTTGLRQISGVVNGDGTVSLYGVSATQDNITNMDNGADPNALWAITDNLAATALPGAESFYEVITPSLGTVVRGVQLDTAFNGAAELVPEPASLLLLAPALGGLLGLRRRNRRAV